MSYATNSDGRGCLFTTPDETVADMVAEVAAALMERPMNLKRVDDAQKALTLEVRKTTKNRELEATIWARNAWNIGRAA